eukprot:1018077_1
MTEFWISNARHYCKECKCWMDGKASSIRKHEEGYRHKGNVDRLLKQLKREKIVAQRESHKQSMEFAAIERAAKKQYIKDCASGLASSDGHCAFNPNRSHHKYKRKDKHRSFLPPDVDPDSACFYYLDKNGTCHGPYPSPTMCKWYHFGFFVGGLRIRKRQDTEFIHLRDIKNPFNYSEFMQKFNTNLSFRTRILQSIDISNASTVPPGIDIPQKLKNEFYKMYPQNDTKIDHTTHPIPRHELTKHDRMFQSSMNATNKQQRRTFIRGHLRKYKSKPKHSDNHKSETNDSEKTIETVKDDDKEIKDDKSEGEKEDKEEVKDDTDDLGFGKWETVTKAEFDAKHSNKQLLQQDKTRKRWWRDTENANLPIAKRKKLMGLANDDTDSENERDYDDEYGIGENIINMNMPRSYIKEVPIDAQFKLKKLHEKEDEIKEQKKEHMLQKLNDCIVKKPTTVDPIVTVPNLFKKKRKKKNRQRGKIDK